MKINKKLLDIFKKTKTTSDEYTYTCSYINDLVEDVYSNNEVKTNKVWIDGKPIYRKVIIATINQNNTDIDLSGTIISNIDAMISISAILKNKYGNSFPVPYLNPNGNLNEGASIIYMGATGIKFRLGNITVENSPLIVIMEYTKTTD